MPSYLFRVGASRDGEGVVATTGSELAPDEREIFAFLRLLSFRRGACFAVSFRLRFGVHRWDLRPRQDVAGWI